MNKLSHYNQRELLKSNFTLIVVFTRFKKVNYSLDLHLKKFIHVYIAHFHSQ